MHRYPRLLPALGLVVALLGPIILPVHARTAQIGTPSSSPISMPETPVGQQLDWVLSQFNGDAEQLTEGDIADRFDPAFLATLPAPLLISTFQETTAQYAPIEFTGFLYPPTETGAIALVSSPTMGEGAITLTVLPDPPHLISRLEFSEAPPPPAESGRRVDIGERSLFINCTGDGSPTVVLEGGISTDWEPVQSTVAEHTRVCSYDRPDSPLSHSDPTSDRTAQQVSDDLYALLEAAGEPGPYVLVGHSLGGLYVQLFAYQHPEDVAGLVLLDPTPEDFLEGLLELLRDSGTPIPEQSGPLNIEQSTYQQLNDARASGDMPQVPMILISHGIAPTVDERPPDWPIEEEEALFQNLHEEIAALVPGSRRIVAEDSKHDIHTEQPDLVVAAITDVVEAVRDPTTWATPVPES